MKNMKQRKFLALIPALIIIGVTLIFAGRAVFMSHSTPVHAATSPGLNVFIGIRSANFQSYKILGDSNGQCEAPAKDNVQNDALTLLTVGVNIQIPQYATTDCSGPTTYNSITNITQVKTYTILLPTNEPAA
jgi:hypothetical protein